MILTCVSHPDQFIQEIKDQRHAAGEFIRPAHDFGMSIAIPRRLGRVEVAFFGEYISPVLSRFEVTRIAGQFVRPQYLGADDGTEVQLIACILVAFAVRLAAGGCGYGKTRPVVVFTGLGIIQNIIGRQRDIKKGHGVPAVLIIGRQPFDDAPCPLAQVAAHPVIGGGNQNRAVVFDAPVGVINEIRRSDNRLLTIHPRVTLECLDRNSQTQIQRAVLSGMPGSNHTIRILDNVVGIIVWTCLSGRQNPCHETPHRQNTSGKVLCQPHGFVLKLIFMRMFYSDNHESILSGFQMIIPKAILRRRQCCLW